jgi:hypothetical protein
MRPRTTLTVLPAALTVLTVAAYLATDPIAAQDPAPEPVPSTSVDMNEMRTDLEVLRRILVREGFGGSAKSRSPFGFVYTRTGRHPGLSHDDGLYVRGDGVQLNFTVDFAVAPSDLELPAPEGADPKRSLWDDVLDDVEGRPKPSSRRLVGKAYDADEVRRAEDAVIASLARYGSRVRHLRADDHVTLVIRGTTPVPRSTSAKRKADGSYEVLLEGGRVRAESLLALGYVAQGSRSPASILTMRFALRDLRAAASGTLDGAGLRERAIINRY